VRKLYGMKDERYSIGFRRSGTTPRVAAKFAQDQYELVVLGVPGFNPFRTTLTAGGRTYIASERNGSRESPVSNPVYNFEYKYSGDDGLVPDFVFDKPIDGAGVLIVNGNLVVADDFAYHGLLVVLGDVIIRPTLKFDQLVYGKDGNPIDAYAYDNYRDSENNPIEISVKEYENEPGHWYYDLKNASTGSVTRTDVELGEDGRRIKDAAGNDIRVQPKRKNLYRGRLTVQGAIMVKGKLVTEKTPNRMYYNDNYDSATALASATLVPGKEGADPGYVHGEFYCYASDAAWKMIDDIAPGVSPAVEVMSWTNSDDHYLVNAASKLWD
jgi:hypothetical protein